MKYCTNCMCERRVKEVAKRETFVIKREPIEVVSDIVICSVCGEELFDEELDGKNLERAYEVYRKSHNLLYPTEIRDLRSRWGSGRSVAALLGWSQATLVRYENGAIPDQAHHEQLLRLRDDPEYIKALFALRGHKLKDREQQKLRSIITQAPLCVEPHTLDPVESLTLMFRAHFVNHITNVEFDFEKLASAVQLFAIRMPGLVKTKLQKLLFYTDFLSTKRYGNQITGMAYVHHYYGPVPINHELVQGFLCTAGVIDVRPNGGPYEGEAIIALENPDMSLFSKEELDVLEIVAGYFKDFTATEISNFSHREKGYLETELKQIIPYSYADDLQLN